MSKKTKAAANATAATETEVQTAAPATTEGTVAATKAVKEKAPKAPKEPKPHVETKADKARAIFARMNGSARKDVVKAFQDEIGLSAAASATYFQNIKSANARAAAKAAEPVTEAAPATTAEVATETAAS